MSVLKPHLWTETNIGDITNVIMGQSPPGDTYNTVAQGLPFYQGKADFGEDFPTPRKWCPTPSRIAEIGDILLSVRAPVGPTNIASERCGIGRGLSAIRAFPEIVDPYFLLYFLRRYEPQLVSRGTGSTFSSVNREDIEGIRIFIPPLPEQQRIVAILRQAADLRRQRREADQLAQKLLPALFNEMFGDPAKNPKGWEQTNLGKIIVDGPQNGLYKPASAYGDGTPILRIGDFDNGTIKNIDKLNRLRLEESEMTSYQLKENDIVVNRVNSPSWLGKSVLVPFLSEKIVFESNMMRFSVDLNKINPVFLIHLLQTPYIKRQILRKAKHAINQSSINQDDVKNFEIILPPIDHQKKFVLQILSAFSLMQFQSENTLDMQSLFSSTLARAFTGELTAAWREAHQPELHSAAAQRDAWLKQRGVRRTVAVERTVSVPVVVAEHSLLAQLSSHQQRLYALIRQQSAPHFTAQSLSEAQTDEKTPLEPDVVTRGLALLESLGLVQQVSVPVSPGGATSYQRVYRIPAAYSGESDLEALRKQYPNIVNTYEG